MRFNILSYFFSTYYAPSRIQFFSCLLSRNWLIGIHFVLWVLVQQHHYLYQCRSVKCFIQKVIQFASLHNYQLGWETFHIWLQYLLKVGYFMHLPLCNTLSSLLFCCLFGHIIVIIVTGLTHIYPCLGLRLPQWWNHLCLLKSWFLSSSNNF